MWILKAILFAGGMTALAYPIVAFYTSKAKKLSKFIDEKKRDNIYNNSLEIKHKAEATDDGYIEISEVME